MPSSPDGRPEPDNATASFGCENCREQHLKCDRQTPVCSRCLASGRECSRGYRFRVKTGPFARKQPWVKTPATVQFVDGNWDEDELDDEWNAHAHADANRQARQPPPAVPAVPASWANLSPDSDSSRTEQPVAAAFFAPALAQSATPLPQSPSDRFLAHDDLEPGTAFDLHAAINAVQSVQSRVYLDRTVFPLQDKQEAVLLRHFVENQAKWLDICDPARHFEMVVPLRAGTCTVLLNAILALAAKSLAHVSTFDRYASDRYHHECLSVLIPLMSHQVTAADENLFAATIVLRVWEELEAKHTGVDAHSYILGIHAFVHGNGHNLRPRTLGAVCFWAGLRQEIYTATMNQQPVKAPLVSALVDGARDLGPAVEDVDWANRAVIHCVDVLNFCFAAEPPQQTWDDLYAWNERWTAALPPSYTPTLDCASADSVFPEVWYHDTWHVTGVQHHLLAKLFLVSFDPHVPRIGGQRREAAKRMNDRICALVRRMCGIGLSNRSSPPSMFTACMAISAFGDRFRQRVDQEAVLELLRRTEKDHGRPTESVQKQMLQAWDWDCVE